MCASPRSVQPKRVDAPSSLDGPLHLLLRIKDGRQTWRRPARHRRLERRRCQGLLGARGKGWQGWSPSDGSRHVMRHIQGGRHDASLTPQGFARGRSSAQWHCRLGRRRRQGRPVARGSERQGRRRRSGWRLLLRRRLHVGRRGGRGVPRGLAARNRRRGRLPAWLRSRQHAFRAEAAQVEHLRRRCRCGTKSRRRERSLLGRASSSVHSSRVDGWRARSSER